jgi:thiol-disulfide isomerase/thioredoxin
MNVITAGDADFKELLEKNENVIVKYYADWCGSCRLFAPKFKRLSGDERFQNVAFLDVNAEKSPEARKAAGVTNLPFFATFKKGVLVEGVPTGKEELVVEMLQKLTA